jgi:hypothetical protein
MNSEEIQYPTPDQVLAELGDKAVRTISLSMQRAKRDLATYRQGHPDWVAASTERGLANWIWDRVWFHLGVLSVDIEGTVKMRDKGMIRELAIGRFRLRFKRHDKEGSISSYETQGFLDFCTQLDGQLPGMEEIRLVAGYVWDRDLREMGDNVMSLRDGSEAVEWVHVLPVIDDEEGGGKTVAIPPLPTPSTPEISVPEGVGQRSEETTEER